MTNLYRPRPIDVEAVQWTDTNAEQLAAFAGHRFMTVDPEDRIDDPDATASLRESAHECWSLLRPSDWVVKRGDDFAVLTPEEFADLYEAQPGDRTNLVAVAAQAIRDSNGSPESLAWWKKYPQLIPAHVYADAVLAVLPPPADRATVLTEATDRLTAAIQRCPTMSGQCLSCEAKAAAIRELRRMAAEAQQQPDTETRGAASQPDICATCHTERCETCHGCRCNKGDENTCGHPDCPATRVKHSGPDTKFCVLCLSGEHERVDEEEPRP